MKKNCLSKNTTRLFVTKDIYSNAYFIRTEKEKFAQLENRNNKWAVWIYPHKYIRYFTTLTESLSVIEKLYKKYWSEKYAIHN